MRDSCNFLDRLCALFSGKADDGRWWYFPLECTVLSSGFLFVCAGIIHKETKAWATEIPFKTTLYGWQSGFYKQSEIREAASLFGPSCISPWFCIKVHVEWNTQTRAHAHTHLEAPAQGVYFASQHGVFLRGFVLLLSLILSFLQSLSQLIVKPEWTQKQTENQQWGDLGKVLPGRSHSGGGKINVLKHFKSLMLQLQIENKKQIIYLVFWTNKTLLIHKCILTNKPAA